MPPLSSSILCSASSFVLLVRYKSRAPPINVVPPMIPPAIVPRPSAESAPVLKDAPPARLPAPSVIAVLDPKPSKPAPDAAEPISEAPRDAPPPAGAAKTLFPIVAAPLPIARAGDAILYSRNAEIAVSSPGVSPPGSSFPTLENRLPMAFLNDAPTASVSKPEAKPSAKDFPMLMPCSAVSDTSMPRSIRMPVLIPVPIPAPMSFAAFANSCFPLPFHHSENGCAIILSHRTLTFPNRSISSNPGVLTASRYRALNCSTLPSNQSINSSTPR